MNKRVELTPTLLVGIALVILAVGFVAGTRSQQIYAFLGPVFGVRTSVETLDTTSLQSTFQALSAYYNGKLDENKLIEGAKEGMVAATGDPYTTYLTADEASEFQKELTGEIGGGIGAEIGIRSGQPTIIRTLPDNPAEKAGLHAGDVIVAVNDESADGWDAEQTVTAIKGEEGTTVKLVVRRGSTTKNFSITRAIINNPSVSSSLEGNVGIITLNRFDEQTNSLVRKAASSLKNRGMKRLVLDLRGNDIWMRHRLLLACGSTISWLSRFEAATDNPKSSTARATNYWLACQPAYSSTLVRRARAKFWQLPLNTTR